jgi:hypothetical protein
MDVFTLAQRESHIRRTTELIRAIQSVQEVENGYELRFPNETEFITKIAEFISNERLCCPFLNFTLNVAPDNEPLSFTLSGSLGAQEFLRLEFGGAIQ